MLLYTVFLFQSIFFISAGFSIEQEKCSKPDCSAYPIHTINIKLGAHSHLDAFWLQKYHQYLYGTGYDESHYMKNLTKIYNNMLYALLVNPKRKYQISEVCFIKPWFLNLTQSRQMDFIGLLKNGQIEVLNGGWVQNDQATTYFDDIIDQLTLGHLFLNKTFGVIPKVAFNIDSFGHSMTQASIYSQMGFNNYIIARLDTEDIKSRIEREALEFIWEPTPSTGVFKDRILVQIRHKRHRTQSWDNPNIYKLSCAQQKDTFEDFEVYLKQIQKAYRSNDIIYFTGDDFEVFDEERFRSIETLINYYKQQPCLGINIDYGTPTEYFEDLIAKKWEIKQYDFFPYREDGLFWTGYFTSSPNYKIIFRDASRYLQRIRKIITQALIYGTVTQPLEILAILESLQEEVALAQHHDGMSATSKYSVMDDVVKRISLAYEKVKEQQSSLLMGIVRYFNPNIKDDLVFQQCTIEMGIKNICQEQMKKQERMILAIYNPIESYVVLQELQFPQGIFYHIYDQNKKIIPADIICEVLIQN